MRWPLSRRAANFAARLDGRQITGSLDDDTAALILLAERLRRVESPVMSPAYAAELRTRLLTAAPELLDSSSPPQSRAVTLTGPPRRASRQLRLGVAAATAIVLATGVGLGFASQKALPGDPLYPFKQGLEQVQVATAGSLLDKGKEQLSQASARLSEVHNLAVQDAPDNATSMLMAGALDDFSSSARDGTTTLVQAYQVDHVDEAIVALRSFNDKSVTELHRLQTQVPPTVLNHVGAAAFQVRSDDAEAVRTCTSCTQQPALVLPASLAAIVPVSLAGSGSSGPGSPAAPANPTIASTVSTDASISVDPTAAAPSSIPPSVIAPPTGLVPPPSSAGSSAPATAGTVTTAPPPTTIPDSSGSPSSDPTTEPPSSAPSTEPDTTATSSVPDQSPTPPDDSTQPVGPPSTGLTSLPPSSLRSAPGGVDTP